MPSCRFLSKWPLFRSFSFVVLLLAEHWALAQGPPRTSSTSVVVQGNLVRATTQVDGPAAYNPSRVLVKFRAGARALLPGSGQAKGFPLDRDLFLVINPPGLSVAEVISRYKANPNVLYAEPDYEVHVVDTTPNDLMWPQQWDMTRIAANSAWDTQKDASDVVVAVIATGIDSTHPDLAGNVISGYNCIGGCGSVTG